MVSQPPYEVRVCIIGCNSAGKTTLLNGILQETFSETGKGRTTASINVFHVVQPSQNRPNTRAAVGPDASFSNIAAGNRGLRETQRIEGDVTQKKKYDIAPHVIQMKEFDIAVTEDICDMRKDTNLTIIEFPGQNEDGIGNKVKKEIENLWTTFDCCVLVHDAHQGVNTSEQVQTLEWVHNLQTRKKEIRVIIGFNKVDEPDNESFISQVAESRERVKEIFYVNNLTECGRDEFGNIPRVFFVPMSAQSAYVYKAGPSMSKERFCVLVKRNTDLLGRLGSDFFPRVTWRNFSEDKKMEEALKIVSDSKNCERGLQDSGYQFFMEVFRSCVGGEERQSDLIAQQVMTDVERPRKTSGEIILSTKRAYEKLKNVGRVQQGSEAVQEAFWRDFLALVDSSKAKFIARSGQLHLAEPLETLKMYFKFAKSIGWETEVDMVVGRTLKGIVSYITEYVLAEEYLPEIQSQMVGAILLMKAKTQFAEEFGGTILRLEKEQFRIWANVFLKEELETLKGELKELKECLDSEDEESKEESSKDEDSKKEVSKEETTSKKNEKSPPKKEQEKPKEAKDNVTIETNNARDPKHFAHAVWLYCELTTQNAKRV